MIGYNLRCILYNSLLVSKTVDTSISEQLVTLLCFIGSPTVIILYYQFHTTADKSHVSHEQGSIFLTGHHITRPIIYSNSNL